MQMVCGRALHEFPHPGMHLGRLLPGDRTFQGINQNSIIHQIFSKIGIGEPALLPALRDLKRRQGKGVVPAGNRINLLCHHPAVVTIAIRGSQQQAALHGLIAKHFEHRIRRRAVDMVHAHGHICLFRVGEAENRGQTKLTLHHFARRPSARILPVMEQVS